MNKKLLLAFTALLLLLGSCTKEQEANYKKYDLRNDYTSATIYLLNRDGWYDSLAAGTSENYEYSYLTVYSDEFIYEYRYASGQTINEYKIIYDRNVYGYKLVARL